MDPSLRPFFRPTGIVIIGASTSAQKLGYGIARNLTSSGYRGAIHFVSQTPGTLFDLPIHPNLMAVPDPLDLAVVAVPAHAVPASIQACADRGIHAAIIISAGFREAGAEGATLEKQAVDVARRHQIRLLGPNCIGVVDTHLPFDTSFLQPPMPPSGGIAFISQSGAFCAAVVDWSRGQGFGFSQIVSLGNEADISEAELLPAVSEDDHTRVIVLYMEGVADGARFVDLARQVTPARPVVALKVGRSDSGQRAAASHTAALAGSDVAFDAAFSKCGILRAATAEQMFDWARALETSPLPRGPRVAVLTDAGGPGVMAADALEKEGLQLAILGDETRRALRDRLPPAASVQNPVDMLASASPDDYALCLRTLLLSPDVDAALIILPPPPMFSALSVAQAIISTVGSQEKPALVALLGSELTQGAFEAFNAAGISTYPFPERAASALGALFRRSTWLASPHQEPVNRPFDVAPSESTSSAADLIASYGIPIPSQTLVTSPSQAAIAASQMGFPVALKVSSPDVLHKSDVGGVLLSITDADSASSGYTQVIDAVHLSLPNAAVDGVLVQRQVTGGQEVILGALRDPQFGPLVMFGAGGIEAEALGDVAFALAPVDEVEADALVRRTWAGRRLDGFRSLPPVDGRAARDALVRLSWLIFEHPEISQIEINPLCVLTQGVVALDARLSH